MRALPCAASVLRPACQPRNERARTPSALERDRQQARRHLLAARDHLVVLGRVVGRGVEALDPADQPVGRPGHGRDDDGHALARLGVTLDPAGDVADAV